MGRHGKQWRAVQNTAQVIERPADVDVRHVDMPVLMRGQWLLKAYALLRWFPFHFDNRPACPNTRHTLLGLTATMFASSIMNVSRR